MIDEGVRAAVGTMIRPSSTGVTNPPDRVRSVAVGGESVSANGGPAGRARRVLRPPPKRYAALELSRSMYEFSTFLTAAPLLGLIGRGDRHPVLVFPGFGADDASTRPLRAVLRAQGYRPHGWRLGRNSPSPELVEAMTERLLDLHARHGAKVSLVGISLGGTHARDLARLHPRAVRQVITLGSPFRFREGDRSTLSWFLERRRQVASPSWPEIPAEHDRPAVPVPVTCIYTRTDGLVRWHAGIEAVAAQRENIEVRGSHSGLSHNIAALIAIADRLAQPEQRWRPFRPTWRFRTLYPAPESWRPPTAGDQPRERLAR